MLELAVLLNEADPALEEGLSSEDLALFATPAINLFERSLEPGRIDRRRRDIHLVADRLRPLDFEVHSLLSASGEGAAGPVIFRPLYALAHPDDKAVGGAYYTLERRQRLATEQEQRRSVGPRRQDPRAGSTRSGYGGGELYLALVDGNAPPWPEGIDRLHVKARCTNRDLPLFMPLVQGQTHFDVDGGPPVSSVQCLGEPTRPRPSLASADPAAPSFGRTPGETPWRLVSHLTLHYLSLVDGADGEVREALRQLLQLYAAFAEPAVARQVDGVRSVASRAVVDRTADGRARSPSAAVSRSMLELEERSIDGGSAFGLGGVLEAFFRRYVALNTFTRTVVRTVERGEIMRWPARIGQRQLI